MFAPGTRRLFISLSTSTRNAAIIRDTFVTKNSLATGNIASYVMRRRPVDIATIVRKKGAFALSNSALLIFYVHGPHSASRTVHSVVRSRKTTSHVIKANEANCVLHKTHASGWMIMFGRYRCSRIENGLERTCHACG